MPNIATAHEGDEATCYLCYLSDTSYQSLQINSDSSSMEGKLTACMTPLCLKLWLTEQEKYTMLPYVLYRFVKSVKLALDGYWAYTGVV